MLRQFLLKIGTVPRGVISLRSGLSLFLICAFILSDISYANPYTLSLQIQQDNPETTRRMENIMTARLADRRGTIDEFVERYTSPATSSDTVAGDSFNLKAGGRLQAEIANGANSTESKANTAYGQFAPKVRAIMADVRRQTEQGEWDSIVSTCEQTDSLVKEYFGIPELVGIKDILDDSLGWNLIQFFVPSKNKNEVFAALNSMEKVLEELDKLRAASRLMDAPKARVQSGVLDASKVLGSEIPAASGAADALPHAGEITDETDSYALTMERNEA